MNVSHSIESSGQTLDLVPQQVDFYRAQLRAIASFAVRGAGADLGVGSRASQQYLNVGSGGRAQNVTSLIWRSPTEADSAYFAVLPPQETSPTFFGVAKAADADGNKLWVEGVNITPVGGKYGRLLVSYNEASDASSYLPRAVGAFIDSMRKPIPGHAESQVVTGLVGMNGATHQKLGKALLTFWDTTTKPADLSVERLGTNATFEVAKLVLNRQVDQALRGVTDTTYNWVTPHRDERGSVNGFIGRQDATRTVTAMLRNPLEYPERIDYIQIPVPAEGSGDDIVFVSHFAISGSAVDLRVCMLPKSFVTNVDATQLVGMIQRDQQPFDTLDERGIEGVLSELHTSLGRLIRLDK